MKLPEIAEAAGCCKASASDIRRGKWTPHVSTWGALAELVGTRDILGPPDLGAYKALTEIGA